MTFARFRVRHQQALAGLLVASLKLCAAAGLVRLGLVSLDGTKVAANAAAGANRTHARLTEQVAQLLEQAAQADRAEDAEHGEARGDELPRALAARSERLSRLQRARAQLEAEAAERQQRYEQRAKELAAKARARGNKPKARYRPRRRDEAPSPRRPRTPPILTAASCAATGAPYRATTPRRPRPWSRSWSRPS